MQTEVRIPGNTVALRDLVTKSGNGHKLVRDARVEALEAAAFADELEHVHPASNKRGGVLFCEDRILPARK